MTLSPRTKVVAEVFNMFDLDGSGEIELDEIARAFRTMGKLTDETREQLKAHFDFMDSDGSGAELLYVCVEQRIVKYGRSRVIFAAFWLCGTNLFVIVALRSASFIVVTLFHCVCGRLTPARTWGGGGGALHFCWVSNAPYINNCANALIHEEPNYKHRVCDSSSWVSKSFQG